MQAIENRLFEIEIKIRNLIEQNNKLQIENTRLKNENSQQTINKSINTSSDENPSLVNLDDIKHKIDQYALEVEECIDIVKSLNK